MYRIRVLAEQMLSKHWFGIFDSGQIIDKDKTQSNRYNSNELTAIWNSDVKQYFFLCFYCSAVVWRMKQKTKKKTAFMSSLIKISTYILYLPTFEALSMMTIVCNIWNFLSIFVFNCHELGGWKIVNAVGNLLLMYFRCSHLYLSLHVWLLHCAISFVKPIKVKSMTLSRQYKGIFIRNEWKQNTQ